MKIMKELERGLTIHTRIGKVLKEISAVSAKKLLVLKKLLFLIELIGISWRATLTTSKNSNVRSRQPKSRIIQVLVSS